MTRLAAAVLAGLLIFSASARAEEGRGRVEVRDGWFYVDGEKFFMKGVCYFENHEVEGRFQRSPLEIMDREFGRIKKAGFNAIRSQLRPAELALAQKHGLMVLQSANHLYFSEEYLDPRRIREHEETTRRIARYSARQDNVLYYLIDNEPQISAGIYRQGEKALRSFHGRLISAVKTSAPRAAVSMATYPPAGFLDQADYDCVSLNLYPFCTACDSIGYEGYLRWFKAKYAPEKPLIVTEYGWEFSRGGKDFSQEMIRLLDSQIEAGAAGSFFYTWRAFGREGKGDNLWLGVVPNRGREGDDRNAPRSIAREFRRYFEAVVIEPSRQKIYSGSIPVRIYGTDRTARIEVEAGGKKFALAKKGTFWWEGEIPSAGPSSSMKIWITAHDGRGNVLVRKKRTVRIAVPSSRPTVSIVREETAWVEGGTYRAKILVRDANGAAVPGQAVRIGINQTGRSLWVSETREETSDSRGQIDFSFSPLLPGYFTVMAGGEAAALRPDIDIVRVEKGTL